AAARGEEGPEGESSPKDRNVGRKRCVRHKTAKSACGRYCQNHIKRGVREAKAAIPSRHGGVGGSRRAERLVTASASGSVRRRAGGDLCCGVAYHVFEGSGFGVG